MGQYETMPEREDSNLRVCPRCNLGKLREYDCVNSNDGFDEIMMNSLIGCAWKCSRQSCGLIVLDFNKINKGWGVVEE